MTAPPCERVISPSFASFLDLARALSAIAVFLNHLRGPLFLPYARLSPDQQVPSVRAWFFVTGFGFAAVMVFFVLSGFLVGGVGLSRIRNRSFRPHAYFIDRLSRIFVVLIPALILTAVLDRVGMHYYGSVGFWDHSNPGFASHVPDVFVRREDLATFVCNATMLQSFYCQSYGSALPLWSLSYEFWFYMCFGVVAIILAGRARTFCALLLIIIIFALGANFAWLAIIWTFGIVAFGYRDKRFRWPAIAIPVFLITATISRVVGPGQPHGDLLDNLVNVAEGAAFAWVLVSMREVDAHWLLWLRPFGSRLASFSYTLYLIHFPVMLFVIAVLAQILNLGNLSNGVPPKSVLGVALYVGVFLIVLAFSWLFASITEAHTARVRSWLHATISSEAGSAN